MRLRALGERISPSDTRREYGVGGDWEGSGAQLYENPTMGGNGR